MAKIMRLALRIAALALALPAGSPSAAAEDAGGTEGATGAAMGASLGASKDERGLGDASNRTLGLWARLGFGGRIWGQLELQETTAPIDDSRLRGASGLFVIDLRRGGRVRPVLLVGAGLDRASYFGGGMTMEGRHFEGGLGLEYRGPGGIFFGADVRLGGRSIDNHAVILTGGSGGDMPEPFPLPPMRPPLPPEDPTGGPLLIAPGIAEGVYGALRLVVGVSF